MRNWMIPAVLMAFTWGAQAQSFKLESPDLKYEGTFGIEQVFDGFGCTGANVSPALSWKSPPADTKSFALLVHDPDAPTGGSGWWHWVMIDIPATVTALPKGAGKSDGTAAPTGARQITTDFGTAGWGGPCPPEGDRAHRYNFTLYALKVEKLEVPPNSSAALVGYMVNANALGKASFSGMYGRKKP